MLTHPRRAYHWYRQSRNLGIALVCIAATAAGWSYASSLPPSPSVAETTTLHHTATVVHRRTRFVTVHVRGKVIRHHDHVLTVYVPRVVFHTRTTHQRIVVPAHVVRIRQTNPSAPPFDVTSAAVIGVAPPAETVTVPVTVTVPGAVTTVTAPPETVTGPTTTVTIPPVTITVPTTITLPADSGAAQ